MATTLTRPGSGVARPSLQSPPSKHLAGVVGLAALVIAWQVVAMAAFGRHGLVPPPTTVLAQMAHDGWAFYWPNIKTTMSEAVVGWLWGNLAAIALALTLLATPQLEKPLLNLGVTIYCLPIVAIGPVFDVVFGGAVPKELLAAMAVFFTTLVGMVVGLKSAERASLDVVWAFGGNRLHQTVKVRLWSAIPSLFAALRIAAPAAVLGAIIGEYLGGSSGLGVAMINSEQSLQIARTWGIALVATAVAALGYGITAGVERVITPWAVRRNPR